MEEADEGQPISQLRPFQESVLEMVNGEASDRAIFWIYSLQGSVGYPFDYYLFDSNPRGTLIASAGRPVTPTIDSVNPPT